MIKKILEWFRRPRKASKKEAKRTIELYEKYKRWAKESKK